MEADDFARKTLSWQEINEQHMLLIEKIGALRLSLLSPNRRETQQRLIDDLLEFANNHFVFEENAMKRQDVPAYQAIRNEHDAFLQKTSLLRQGLDHKGFRSAMELLSFLTDWLQDHIQLTGIQHAG